MEPMFDFAALQVAYKPYTHWLGKAVSDSTVVAINKEWPSKEDPRWIHEDGRFAKKSAILFPTPLSEKAQELATYMFSPEVCVQMSELVGIPLQPDPWYMDGPAKPLLGGGLHEIHRGGLLKMHTDFNRHPTGLRRCLNVLIYLNRRWDESWGGAIELHGERHGRKYVTSILPTDGMVVIFVTNNESWHGHPEPMKPPAGITRRSLALYYYTKGTPGDRDTTVYIK